MSFLRQKTLFPSKTGGESRNILRFLTGETETRALSGRAGHG